MFLLPFIPVLMMPIGLIVLLVVLFSTSCQRSRAGTSRGGSRAIVIIFLTLFIVFALHKYRGAQTASSILARSGNNSIQTSGSGARVIKTQSQSKSRRQPEQSQQRDSWSAEAASLAQSDTQSVAIATIEAPHAPDAPEAPAAAEAPATGPTTKVSNQWVHDWPAFKEETSWHGFRSESQNPCVTEAEARQSAIDYAADQLSQILATYPAIQGDSRYSERVLREFAQGKLSCGELIADEHISSDAKSYATLFKTYLLIDTAPQKMNGIIRDLQSTMAVTTTRQLTTWGSVAALSAVIVLLYAFLNAATKGYFVWRLRAVAMMVLIVALLVVMAWN